MRSWFRVDPGAVFDKKVEAAGNEAFGAWVRAGAWSAGNLTDGHIPRATAHKIAPPRVWARAIAAELVEATDVGYQIHDYLDWNPSADEVRSKSAKRAAAGRLGGKANAIHQETMTPPVEPPDSIDGPEANAQAIASADASPIAQADAQAIAGSPAPARERSPSGSVLSFPDSSLEGSPDLDPEIARPRESQPHANGAVQGALFVEPAEVKRRRGVKRALPDGWAPKAAAFALGRELGFDEARVRFEAAQFVDGASASDRLCVRWDPAFNNWLRIAKKRDGNPFGNARSAGRGGPARPNPSMPAFAPLSTDDRPWTPDDEAPL